MSTSLFERCKDRINKSKIFVCISQWKHQYKIKNSSGILRISKINNGLFSSYSVYFDDIEIKMSRREKKKLFKLASERDDFLRLIEDNENIRYVEENL